jgi:DNA-binding NarL/FixJ family response regulator
MTPIRVGAVEDDTDLREELALVLSADPRLRVVGLHRTAEEVSDTVLAGVDVLLVDVNLPGTSGVEFVRIAKAAHPARQFIMYTVQDDDHTLFEALRAGATGYVVKTAPPEQLVQAIIDVHQGGSPMSAGIARRVLASFNADRDRAKEFALLTERERQVLKELAKGHRYKEIADTLHLSIDTVRTHIRNLYDKLQVSSRTDALNKLYPR